MRYFIAILLSAVLLMSSSCKKADVVKHLEYQEAALSVNAVFSVNDSEVPVLLELEAPEYDETGRMLARSAVLTFGEDSIISGVSFEYVKGDVYISSGNMRIRIEDTDTVRGISELISLFCISDECYYSSENVNIDGLECEKAIYVDGDNRVEVTVDLSCGLPVTINAVTSGREISADIKFIKAK